MNDLEKRIEKLEKTINWQSQAIDALESTMKLFIFVPGHSISTSQFKEIRIDKVISLLLNHLGMKIVYIPEVSSSFILEKNDD